MRPSTVYIGFWTQDGGVIGAIARNDYINKVVRRSMFVSLIAAAWFMLALTHHDARNVGYFALLFFTYWMTTSFLLFLGLYLFQLARPQRSIVGLAVFASIFMLGAAVAGLAAMDDDGNEMTRRDAPYADYAFDTPWYYVAPLVIVITLFLLQCVGLSPMVQTRRAQLPPQDEVAYTAAIGLFFIVVSFAIFGGLVSGGQISGNEGPRKVAFLLLYTVFSSNLGVLLVLASMYSTSRVARRRGVTRQIMYSLPNT